MERPSERCAELRAENCAPRIARRAESSQKTNETNSGHSTGPSRRRRTGGRSCGAPSAVKSTVGASESTRSSVEKRTIQSRPRSCIAVIAATITMQKIWLSK